MKYLILLSFFVYFLILLSQKLNIPPFFNINVFFMFYFILFLLYFFKIKKIHTLKPKKAFLFLKTTPKKVIILNLPLTPIERIRLIWLKFKRKIKRSYGRFKTIVIQFYNWILLKFNIINSKIENLKILIYMRYLFIGDQVTRIYLKIQKSIKIIYKNIKNLISYSVLYIKKKIIHFIYTLK